MKQLYTAIWSGELPANGGPNGAHQVLSGMSFRSGSDIP